MRCRIPHRTSRGWDASRHVASMGQWEVQIKADDGRAEPIRWKSCLIPLMHGFELVCFRCGMPAAVVSFLLRTLLIDCSVAYLLHAVTRFPDANSHSCRMLQAHECAVGYHAVPFVAGMRPGALRQLGSARSRFKRPGRRTVGVQHGVRKRCRSSLVCDFFCRRRFPP